MYGVVNGRNDQTIKSYRDKITVNFAGVAPGNVGGGRLLANNVSNIISDQAPAPADGAGSVRASVGALVLGLGVAMFVLQ
jgi:hypothetical protein